MSARNTANNVFRATMVLVVRLGVAFLMVAHAWYRWQIEGLSGQIERLDVLGAPAASLVTWGTIVFEAVGGVMLAIGLLTRVIGLLLALEHVLIGLILKWNNGIFLADGGFEYNLAMALLGLLFFGYGAGMTGLDKVIFRRRKKPEASADLYQPKLGTTEI